jgi:hypothetical protein
VKKRFREEIIRASERELLGYLLRYRFFILLHVIVSQPLAISFNFYCKVVVGKTKIIPVVLHSTYKKNHDSRNNNSPFSKILNLLPILLSL